MKNKPLKKKQKNKNKQKNLKQKKTFPIKIQMITKISIYFSTNLCPNKNVW